MSRALELVGGPLDGARLVVPDDPAHIHMAKFAAVQPYDENQEMDAIPVGNITYVRTNRINRAGLLVYLYQGDTNGT